MFCNSLTLYCDPLFTYRWFLTVMPQNKICVVVLHILTCLWAPGSPYKLLEENVQPQCDLKPIKVHISKISTQHREKWGQAEETNSMSASLGVDEHDIIYSCRVWWVPGTHLQQQLHEEPPESRNLSAPYPSTRAQTCANTREVRNSRSNCTNCVQKGKKHDLLVERYLLIADTSPV